MFYEKMLDRIAAAGKLTPTEKKIALYFERETSSLAFEDLETLRKKIGVSTSSVSRFVMKLGYTNFKDFSFELRQNAAVEFDTPLKRHAARLKEQNTPESALEQHLSDVILAVQHTLKSLRPKDFARAVDLIDDSSRHLYIYGGAVAESSLSSFALLLGYVRANFTLLKPDLASTSRVIADPEKDSVLLTVCNDPFSKATGKVLRYFYENERDTILITDSHSCPYMKYGKVPLVLYRLVRSPFSTRCTVNALLEAFVSALSMKRGNQDKFKQTADLMHRFDLFEK